MSFEKLQAGSTTPAKRLDCLDHVFSMMNGRKNGTQKGGLILTGDPGVGKTSFVKQLAQVIGVKLITVETPHLVEEHIVNIPFIVFNPANNTETTSVIKGGVEQGGKFVVKIADSDLYNQIAHVQAIPEATALASIYRVGGLVKQLHEELGGTKDSFDEVVESLRAQFRCILFLDEYYRETSAAIRNMLRGILDNKIGLHEMPKTVYTIFASNMNGGSEEGIEQVAGNQDYRAVEFDAPGKDEWFNYLIKKYEADNTRVKLKPEIVKAFYEVMHEDHMSTQDFDKDIRISPRRWEQLLTYVNAALPCSSATEARHLLKNVHVNFRHYQSGAHYGGAATKAVTVTIENGMASVNYKAHGKKTGDIISISDTNDGLLDKDHTIGSAKANSFTFEVGGDDRVVKKAQISMGSLSSEVYNMVAELIRTTSNIDLGSGEKSQAAPDGDWRDTLKHQIEMKMKLGNERHYVPVLAGLPGVGKTSHVFAVAYELGLVPVYINVSNLSAEDVIGLPIANKGKGDDIAVEFSEPMLKQIVDKAIKAGEADMQAVLKDDGEKIDMAAFRKKEHKYLVFFDELNRASTKVFNALRRVLLEKKFTDDVGLPDGSIVISAINPHDLGTTKLTSHMRDVLDIIPTGSSWKQTEDYMSSYLLDKISKETKNAETAPGVLALLKAFYSTFSNPNYRTKTGTEEDGKSQFHLDIGHSDVYISPREWCDMFSGTCNYLDIKITRFKRLVHREEDGAVITAAAAQIQTDLYEGVKASLLWIIQHKHETTTPTWFKDFKAWVEHAPEADTLGLTKKKVSILGAKEVYLNAFKHPNVRMADDSEFINYMNNVDATTFKNELTTFIMDQVESNGADFVGTYQYDMPTVAIKNKQPVISSLHNPKEFHRVFGNPKLPHQIHSGLVVKHGGKDHSAIPANVTPAVKAAKTKEHEIVLEAGHVKVSHYEAFLHEILCAIYIHNLSNEFIDLLYDVAYQVIENLSDTLMANNNALGMKIISCISRAPDRIKRAKKVYQTELEAIK